MVLRYISRYRFIGLCGLVCLALDGIGGCSDTIDHRSPGRLTGHNANAYRWSQPGKDRHDFYVSRLDCLRNGNERFMTSCMAVHGWRLDPNGFESPTIVEVKAP